MRERVGYLKDFTLKLALQYVLVLLNLVSIFFVLVYSIINTGSVAGNVFGMILLITVILDFLYAAMSKNKWGLWVLVGSVLCMLLNHGMNLLYDRLMVDSVMIVIRVISSLSLILALSSNIGLLVCDMLRIETKPYTGRWFKVLRVAIPLLLPAGLFFLAFLSYDLIFNFGYTPHEYTINRAEVFLLLLVAAVFCLFLRFVLVGSEGSLKSKLTKNAALLLITTLIGAYAFANFSTGLASVPATVKAAEAQYQRVFGESSSAYEKKEFKQTPFSMGDYFMGKKQNDFRLQKDVYYYQEGETSDSFRLAYDVYYPKYAQMHRSALVVIHGRSNDKGMKNNPAFMKYFASQGYVVFDLQVGDYLEANTNFKPSSPEYLLPSHTEMYPNILRFFEFATDPANANKVFGANFQNTFLAGFSMGGGLTCQFGLDPNNGLENLDATLRGIIPYYPSDSYDENSVTNYLANVNASSVPCAMFMGSHDSAVERDIYYKMQDAYAHYGNNGFMGVWGDYSGHGSDVNFNSRSAQIMTYYVERFMRQLQR